MKSTKLPRQDSIHSLIRDATNAPQKDLAQIENIMRDEIFHSTLDWQTREQLAEAARQALALLNDNRQLYEFGQDRALAVFHQIRTASATNH